jgi:magnesium chelatase family protein
MRLMKVLRKKMLQLDTVIYEGLSQDEIKTKSLSKPVETPRSKLRGPRSSLPSSSSKELFVIRSLCLFMLAVALNPCPCGYYTDSRHKCSCRPEQIQKYMGKISGPLLDRIDIHVEVSALSYDELANKSTGADSAAMREQVAQCRKVQTERFQKDPKIFCNAHMESRHLQIPCQLEESSMNLLKTAIDKLGLSARAFDRIHKVARTIADLEGKEKIESPHIAEAIQYRSLDRKLWMGG